ncbi:AAA family ATPase [Streptomyces sp. IBSNAI002]|uniref:AAA family ATPase n=1 Tax=Streptomyces sp. IBSNAI002 TaxID=3457500 RepID=UPI003FD36BD2
MSELSSPPKLRTRKPTGVIPWPVLLIEGEEKAGKSHTAAAFTGSDKTGQAYWLELGEETAEEYINVPGADYELIEHNGSYRDILGQIEAVHAEAVRAARAKEKPVVLVIDSVSNLWRMLVNWTQVRAQRSVSGRKKLEADPDAEIKPTMNLWNDAGERWARVMYLVRTMPGIVILLARGKEIAALDERGEPIPRAKATDWRVEGQKSLAYDATVWVRLRREADPQIVGARSLKFSVPRSAKKPMHVPDFTIEHLVFGLMGCAIHNQPKATPELTGDLAQVWEPKVKAAAEAGVETLKKLWWDAEKESGLDREELAIIRNAIERKAAELSNPKKLDDPTSEAARLRAAAAQVREEADGSADFEAAA